MGITIHFQGKLKNKRRIHSLMDEFIDIAKVMKWKWQSLDEDWLKPSTAKLNVSNNKAEITGHLPLKGVQLSLHPDCESFSVYFDPNGNLTTPMNMILVNEGQLKPEESFSSVKTQFAPPEVHISIIKLLRMLKNRYIPDLKVFDEGEYWDTGDKDKLLEKMKFLQDKIDIVAKALSSVDVKFIQKCSSEQLAKLLEDKIKKGDKR